MKFGIVAICLALTAAPLGAKALKVTEPFAENVIGKSQVTVVAVTVSDTAAPIVAKLDAKAAEKRVAAKLTPIDAAAPSVVAAPDVYETLPLVQMMPLVVTEGTRAWGMTSGRAVKLTISIDTLKTADAGMAMLLSSTDQLAGIVSVTDAASGEHLGEFYVDVLNARAGLLGLAMRGSGVREKLAVEFTKRVSQQLSGSKSKLKTATL